MKENIISRIIKRPKNYARNDLPIETIKGTSIQTLRDLTRYGDSDNYDNGYSSIRAIADQFLQIPIYGIDANGKKMDPAPNAIRAIYRPNTGMSAIDFRNTLATKTLVFDKVYVLVHESFGTAKTQPASERVKEEKIAGYTFLEGVVEDKDEFGKLFYKIWHNNQEYRYYPYQVMVFADVNPNSVGYGYSPSRAAKRWTRIDDYIADYQAGFFENGAVPAGQFVITAPTVQEYNDIVDGLEHKHRGAGANNNVVYTYQPIDQNSGKPSQAVITWVPFNTSNKDLALKDILEATNAKTDSVYRVSAMQRAITDAPNYATAKIDDQNFAVKTIYPFTLKLWQRFQHELNRITGGLGYGISFEFEAPHIAEEEQVKAATNDQIWQTLKDMMLEGFTYDSACDALKLPANWKLLVVGDSKVTTIDNEKVAVVQEDENDTSPTPIVDHAHAHFNDAITEEDRVNYQTQLAAPTAQLMDKQIEHAIDSLDALDAGEATQEDKDQWNTEMMAVISAILLAGGIDQWEKGKQLLAEAGLDVPAGNYDVAESALTRYKEYLSTVADSYTEDTAKAIRSVLERATVDDISRTELVKNLRAINTLDEWRVTRLAKTEVNRSGAISSVEAMTKVADDTGVTIEQTLESTTGTPCQFCLEFIDVWIPVGTVMLKKGETVEGKDGGKFVNNWDTNHGHDPHANGNCVPIYRVAT